MEVDGSRSELPLDSTILRVLLQSVSSFEKAQYDVKVEAKLQKIEAIQKKEKESSDNEMASSSRRRPLLDR